MPTVYLDTSVLSALHYKGGSPQGIKRATATREWWENERQHFRVFTSRVTEQELRQGAFAAQEAAIAEARRLPYLSGTRQVEALARAYVDAGLVPAKKVADAFQLAFATVYEVDYLMTWNQAHLANDVIQARLEKLNQRFGWRSPWLVSPESIHKVALGQSVRRKD